MPKKIYTFTALRMRCLQQHMTIGDLEHAIGVGKGAISHRLRGCGQWSISEIYKVCQALDIDPVHIPEYWPRKEVTR